MTVLCLGACCQLPHLNTMATPYWDCYLTDWEMPWLLLYQFTHLPTITFVNWFLICCSLLKMVSLSFDLVLLLSPEEHDLLTSRDGRHWWCSAYMSHPLTQYQYLQSVNSLCPCLLHVYLYLLNLQSSSTISRRCSVLVCRYSCARLTATGLQAQYQFQYKYTGRTQSTGSPRTATLPLISAFLTRIWYRCTERGGGSIGCWVCACLLYPVGQPTNQRHRVERAGGHSYIAGSPYHWGWLALSQCRRHHLVKTNCTHPPHVSLLP